MTFPNWAFPKATLVVVVAVVVLSVVEVVAEEPPSLLLLQEKTVKLKRDMRITCKIYFILLPYQL